MKLNSFRFNTLEFSGSLGDLGTLIPLSLGMIMVCGLSTSTVFIMIGLFYILSGLYFQLPLPVQPLKVVAAIAIAYPGKITVEVIAASGIIFGVILLILGLSGLIDQLAKFFKKPIIRGIQLGLGLILASKGLNYIMNPALFSWNSTNDVLAYGLSCNLILGFIMVGTTLFFLNNKRFPAALIVVGIGIVSGLFYGGFRVSSFETGTTGFSLYFPSLENMGLAFFLLVIPQIPLTLGNAVIGTADTCFTLFGKGKGTENISYRSLAVSMGITNCITGLVGGMPMCHGAGGLAAHYRFGARTGGSNIMIGAVFLVSGLFLGKLSFALLSCLPNAVFGTLLLFAGLELALLIRDINAKNELFVTLLIGCISINTNNMGIAFIVGIAIDQLIRWKKIEL
ncbi:MAG: putative sulfate/molybdate transporter [Candidatus Magnetomorum sp.]|nr:putative sulfate/molybdate transporter [Candidatus Magnetomorum sp.]